MKPPTFSKQSKVFLDKDWQVPPMLEWYMANSPSQSAPSKQSSYRWPWLLLAAILLAIVLAFLWLSKEVQRTRRQRDINSNGLGLTSAMKPLRLPASF